MQRGVNPFPPLLHGALRQPELAGRPVLQSGNRVANRGRSDTDDRWILGRVDDLVDLLGLEAGGVAHALAVGGELPVGARNGSPRSLHRVAHGQHRRGSSAAATL